MKRLMKIIVILVFVVSNANYSLADGETTGTTLEEELRWLQAESIVFIGSRHEQKVSEVPAAVFVISQEDIKRSGVTTIPDALRLVPGLHVARIDSNIWAVTSRGFSDRFTNKLLVLIDGRTIYTPLFAGVYWEREDTLIEDIERIEIIRGPGAALWGANAVNGIINIITKNAKDTQGGFVVAGGGSEERGFGSIRFGGKPNDKTYCKGYVKYSDRDDFTSAEVKDTMDSWDIVQGGFKIDRNITDRDSLTLQGDIYNMDGGDLENVATPFPLFANMMYVSREADGRNIMGRWKRTFSDTSDMILQLYYDYGKVYSVFYEPFEPCIKTYDVDFQHRFQLSDDQDIIWGLGYRLVSDDIATSSTLSINPSSRDAALYSAFLQDEIILKKDRLKLTLGSKFEDNYYSGFEVQPSGRLLWTPNERHTIWTSISQAVVTPSRARFDTDPCYTNPLRPPNPLSNTLWAITKLSGNRNFESEELIAYELGYRVKPSDRLSLDVASFYNDYDKLQTYEMGLPFLVTVPTPFLAIPVTLGNKMSGETYGIELSSQWLAKQWLRFNAAYSYLYMNLHLASDSTDPLSESMEKASPKNQFRLSSSMDLPRNVELDAVLRYVDNLPAHKIHSYTEMDLCLGWKPLENVKVSLVGQNLLDKHHPEFPGNLFGLPLTEVERGVYAKVRWEF